MTLVEILVVIALIAVVGGIAIVQVGGVLEGGNQDAAKSFVTSSLKTPLTQYRIHMGRYPSTAEGLQALITAPGGDSGRWRGPYIDTGKVPEDPWGNPYQYRFPGQKNPVGAAGYDLWSTGPSEGADDDIGNWD